MSSLNPPLWQSLENPSLHSDEFASGASVWPAQLSRRNFLEFAAAALAASGMSACVRKPAEKMVPYLKNPEGVVPDKPLYFSTMRNLAGHATGLLVESHMGRPTKVDGHPDHPAARGAASASDQAYLLSLYDANRSNRCLHRGESAAIETLHQALAELREVFNASHGEGLYLFTELSSSPTLLGQIQQMRVAWPKLKWVTYEPVSNERRTRAAQTVFGARLEPVYHLNRADTVVCLDADPFGSPLFPLTYARDFMMRHQGPAPAELFVFEPTPSLTGAWTSRRARVSSRRIEELARLFLEPNLPLTELAPSELLKNIFARRSLPGKQTLFLAGEYQSEVVHQVCHHLNSLYAKEAVTWVSAPPADALDLPTALAQLQKNPAAAILIFGGNPVYNSPGHVDLQAEIKKAKRSFRFGLTEDETSRACEWHAPLAHDFETWSDARAFDGTVTFAQPLLEPLFKGESITEILANFMGKPRRALETMRQHWQEIWRQDFAMRWDQAVASGMVLEKREATPHSRFRMPAANPKAPPGIEILFRADPTIFDGRFAGNAWLQELPKPLTKLTWDNAALVSPALAAKLRLKSGQVARVETARGALELPVWIMPGQADDSITLAFGYGRTHGGKVAHGLGQNIYAIWDMDQPDAIRGSVTAVERHVELASTQIHQVLSGNEIIKRVPRGNSKPSATPVQASLYPQDPTAGEAQAAWGMVIDLDTCIGCSACVIACQSENNIPVVGKAQVLLGREMHWLRIDRYHSGEASEPRTYFQPVPCMQCEKAPCEEVCPVAATVHSTDGLNQMIYNRCVGTRYCSNNCPYKVRRFNFLKYNAGIDDLQKLQKNPEVSVRARGVMEKCTYCVQRVTSAQISARIENRAVADGEVRTACQVTCPTQAIAFGNLNDEKSRVRTQRESGRNYALLEELGTRPRTTYLAKTEDPA